MQDLTNFKNLLLASKRWQKAVNLRSYINAFEQLAMQKGLVDDRLIKWLEWAHKKADWYDPFVEKDDELLEDVNRDSLNFKEKSMYSR